MIVETKPLWSPRPQEQLIGLVHMTTVSAAAQRSCSVIAAVDEPGTRFARRRRSDSLEVRVGERFRSNFAPVALWLRR